MQYPNPHPVADESVGASPNRIKLRDVCLRKTGRRAGQDIWIVDGARVRRDIFDEFLQGGNDQRYRFVPQNEVWIDGSTSVEEYWYSVMHELFERNQMLTKAMTYDRAHREALMLELGARRRCRIASDAHELRRNGLSDHPSAPRARRDGARGGCWDGVRTRVGYADSGPAAGRRNGVP